MMAEAKPERAVAVVGYVVGGSAVILCAFNAYMEWHAGSGLGVFLSAAGLAGSFFAWAGLMAAAELVKLGRQIRDELRRTGS